MRRRHPMPVPTSRRAWSPRRAQHRVPQGLLVRTTRTRARRARRRRCTRTTAPSRRRTRSGRTAPSSRRYTRRQTRGTPKTFQQSSAQSARRSLRSTRRRRWRSGPPLETRRPPKPGCRRLRLRRCRLGWPPKGRRCARGRRSRQGRGRRIRPVSWTQRTPGFRRTRRETRHCPRVSAKQLPHAPRRRADWSQKLARSVVRPVRARRGRLVLTSRRRRVRFRREP